MRLWVRLAIFFYVFLITVVGVSVLFLLMHWVDLSLYQDFIGYLYFDRKAGLIAIACVSVIVFLSLLFAKMIYGRQEKERVVYFNNAIGRVTISTTALEDLVRRLVLKTPQIKDIRPDIKAVHHGVNVYIRLALRSDAHIPELTANLQEAIRRKMVDVLGADAKVNVRIHISKVVLDTSRFENNDVRNLEEEDLVSPMPFHGYRV